MDHVVGPVNHGVENEMKYTGRFLKGILTLPAKAVLGRRGASACDVEKFWARVTFGVSGQRPLQ